MYLWLQGQLRRRLLAARTFIVGTAGVLGKRGPGRKPHARSSVPQQRDRAADERDDAAARRDKIADRRDEVADGRDRAADRRVAQQRGRVADDASAPAPSSPGADTTGEARSNDRGVGSSERAEAERDRDASLADRGASARERARAGLDRDASLADRGASAQERVYASVDVLTGVYLRGAGTVELEHEVARASRTGEPLVLAFVDVDHLKTINDSLGHSAGDRMLIEVARILGTSLRSYDLIIRYGGDEFVCVLPGVRMADATERLGVVNKALAQETEHGSVTVGLAELNPGESAEQLVERADQALLEERARLRGGADT